ncbi:helicase HerA domain-containing protein [Campylobacter fetus]|uniref:DUF853 family protein n=3 Tax=Campylobacterales TaxID=213849 RepID=A0A5L8QK63_CAMFE|nr:DUF87 domain-containing protein [Campylobacter fetus]EAI4414615.1 DUF853 family protein [Campylobacter fetus]EAK0415365.1 DUF853 family protein [Campylobacter fetus]EAK0452782.1 DUF853 family protein [Campylobacter fetus]EAL3874057.1 ATP-binding protein [Campylobacter fetus]EGK8150697.1 DUF853 family protein [Campylobacter fetus]
MKMPESGEFYLGLSENTPYIYDSKDLLTHAAIIGMTGSGKTGLGISLLEEASLNQIPTIIIDPKGDMTNLCLALSSEDEFIEVCADKNVGSSVYEQYKAGLESSFENFERVKKFKNSSVFKIFTPKSNAGLGVSLLSDFNAPKFDDFESLNSYIIGICGSILSLVGVKNDDFSSPEMLILQNIFFNRFSAKKDLSIAQLIEDIINPKFKKIGVFDVESFYPADKRADLAMKINALVASPDFSLWCSGEKLDISNMLFENGKPRSNIFTISHLDDASRMFFVTILLNEMVSWMRSLEGTHKPRVVLYMDEIFGYFPPSSNPPSKLAMLTLLKQARAFGICVVLSTQNPVDIDYKGLSNIGTWFIGRLQTAQDKQNVISGLSGVGKTSDKEILDTLSNLKKRQFLVKNIHDTNLQIITTRWALSYLKGPLNKNDISNLMKHFEIKNGSSIMLNSSAILNPDIVQIYEYGNSNKLFCHLLGTAKVRFISSDDELIKDRIFCLKADSDELDWSNAEEISVSNFSCEKYENIELLDAPRSILNAKNLNEFVKSFTEFLYTNEKIVLYKAFDIVSNLNESKDQFVLRVKLRADELLKEQKTLLMNKFEKEKSILEKRLLNAKNSLEKKKNIANKSGIFAAIEIVSGVLSAVFRKRLSSTKILSSTKKATDVFSKHDDMYASKETMQSILNEINELQSSYETKISELKESFDIANLQIDEKILRPKKSDILNEKVSVLWKS